MSSSIYSDKLRVRACGLLVEQEKLLLISLNSPVSKKAIWTAPGGGVEFGESLKEAVKREFAEETGLEVKIRNLVFVNELLEPPFHAIEFFFEVERIKGELMLGKDPEHSNSGQILKDIRFFSEEELKKERDVKPELLLQVFKIMREGNSIKASLRDGNE